MPARLDSDQLLKSVLNSAPYGIMTLKALRNSKNEIIDFEILLLNNSAEEFTRLKTELILGKRLLKILPGSKKTGLFKKYCEVAETGESISIDQHYQDEHFDKWFRIKATKLSDGLTVSFLDISDFKSRAIELSQSEARYRKLFNESMDSIFLANNELLFLEINDSMVAKFGYTGEIIRTISLKEFFKDEMDFVRFNKGFYKNGRVEEFEAELLMANGDSVICLINLINLRPEENLINVYQGVIQDISRKKKAEEEILWAEKLSMTGKIARSIAHEVRNPLTNLSLALEQLKDEVPDELEDADLYFDIIKRNANRINDLVTELLNSSKPRSLKLTSQPLNNAVKESLKLVKDRLKLQNMKLKQSYGKNLPDISLDNDQIRIALLNILINAIEAMKPDQGALTIKTYLEEGFVKLEVSDNGKGIPAENLSKLFEPFFTAKKGGMGLGLTTFQNIIQSHLGKVKVTSELGVGTTFLISFPV